jgi:broad specificity phosphatase PhoE
MRKLHIEVLVSSDLTRAWETARILGEAWRIGVRCDADLRERELGAWTGLTEVEIASRWPAELARLRSGDPDADPGGGETLGQLRDRVARALDRLSAFRGRRVAVVTHLGVIQLLRPDFEPQHATACLTRFEGCRALLEGAGSGRPADLDLERASPVCWGPTRGGRG